MDKGDIWLPQKMAPMLGKIPEADELATGGLLTLGQKLTILVTRKVGTWWFGLSGKMDCLICHILKGWSVICGLIIWKENKLLNTQNYWLLVMLLVMSLIPSVTARW